MPHAGRIYLYASDNHLIDARKYFTIGQRRMLMKQWMKMYEGLGYYFQIDARSPYTRLTPKEEKEIELKKIVRPAAVYTNLPVYKYCET